MLYQVKVYGLLDKHSGIIVFIHADHTIAVLDYLSTAMQEGVLPLLDIDTVHIKSTAVDGVDDWTWLD